VSQTRQSVYPGLGPQALTGSPSNSGSAGAFPFENYQTPLLDLTIGQQLGIEIFPARPGYIVQVVNRSWLVESLSGTQTVPPSLQIGSNAAHNNIQALNSSPTNANVNGFTTPFYTSGGGIIPTGLQQIANATAFLDIITGASGTGGFALKARYVLSVFWVAVGGSSI
jgi:hypothetical protein